MPSPTKDGLMQAVPDNGICWYTKRSHTELVLEEAPRMLMGIYAPNTPTLIGNLGVTHQSTEEALKQIGQNILSSVRSIDAVVAISPHFMTRGGFGIVSQTPLRQIYDFSGFPQEFYQVTYQAPGAIDIAEELARLCVQEHLPAAITTEWGLDHGAWSPLLHLFPQANVPIVPVSIAPELGEAAHEHLGRILRRLSEQRTLVLIATGSLIHRLDLWAQPTNALPKAAQQYLARARMSFAQGTWDALWNAPEPWKQAAAPEGGELPLRVMAGAFPQFRAEIVAEEDEFDAVSLTTVRFVDV
ncbi:hypothetical protein CO251_04895 [Sulfobacillus sp. hq2]|nr:hypothetical protein CO251_04895 [Sulfobacillus sp. hq2]